MKLLSGLILSGLAVVVISQNVEPVTVRFLFWTTIIPFSVFSFLLFALGIAAGWLLHGHAIHRRSKAGQSWKSPRL